MEPVGRARRQTGATRWALFQDAEDPALILETFTVANWSALLTDDRSPRARHLLPPDEPTEAP